MGCGMASFGGYATRRHNGTATSALPQAQPLAAGAPTADVLSIMECDAS